MSLSAAVLAGGMSSRMGCDKAFLELDGRPLVAHVAERLRDCADEVFVVAKHTEPFEALGLRALNDSIDEATPLAGVLTALRSAEHDRVFVCACDMPFVSCELVRFLSSRIEDHDVAVPRHGDRAEPLHAVWSSGVAVRVEEALSAGERAVHRALERLRVAWIEEDEWRPLDPEARSFVNINTLEELYQLINP